MFKKLKDKIAEEVKQSPLKSVQQLAQAVVSPSSSSVFEPSSSNDKFCIEEGDIEEDEVKAQTEVKTGGFTSVTLTGHQITSPLRDKKTGFRSSSSSFTTEADNIFPTFDSQPTNFHVQSDWESASEVEDRYSQLEHINKESLYEAYRKVYNRYNKMKNKHQELITHYRLLEKEKDKAKSVLAETQDKTLMRIGELKEQCLLEQQAKAHLEEALRNELEERDHIINTLKTKVQYLKTVHEGIVSEHMDVHNLEKKEADNLIDFTENLCVSKVPLPSDASNKESTPCIEEQLERCKKILLDKISKVDKLEKELEEMKECKPYEENSSYLSSDNNCLDQQKSKEELKMHLSLTGLINELEEEAKNMRENGVYNLPSNCINKSVQFDESSAKQDIEELPVSERTTHDSEIDLSQTSHSISEGGDGNNISLSKCNHNTINSCDQFKELRIQNDLLQTKFEKEAILTENLKSELNTIKKTFCVVTAELEQARDNLKKENFNFESLTLTDNDVLNNLSFCVNSLYSTKKEFIELKHLKEKLEDELVNIKEKLCTLKVDRPIQTEDDKTEQEEKISTNKLMTLNEELQEELKSIKNEYNILIEKEGCLSKTTHTLTVENHELENKIKSMIISLENSEKECNILKQESLQASLGINDEISFLKNKISNLDGELENSKKEYLFLLKSNEKDLEDLTFFKNKNIEISEQNNDLQLNIEKLRAELEESKKHSIDLSDNKDKMLNEMLFLKKQCNDLINEKESTCKKISDLENCIEKANSDLFIAIEEKEKLINDLSLLRKEYDTVYSEKCIVNDMLSNLEKDLKNNKGDLILMLEEKEKLLCDITLSKKELENVIAEKNTINNNFNCLEKDFMEIKRDLKLALEAKEKSIFDLSLLKKECDRFCDENNILKENLNKIENEHEITKKELELSMEKITLLSDEISLLKSSNDNLTKENVNLNNIIDSISKKLENNQTKDFSTSEEKSKLFQEIELLKKEQDDSNISKKRLQNQIEKLEDELCNTKKEMLSLEETKEKLCKTIQHLSEEFEAKIIENNSVQDKFDNLLIDNERSKDENIQLLEAKLKLGDELDVLRIKHSDTVEMFSVAKKQLEDNRTMYTDLEKRFSDISETLKRKCVEFEEKCHENEILRTDNEKLLKKLNENSSVVENITKEKQLLLHTLQLKIDTVRNIRNLQKHTTILVQQFRAEIIKQLNDVKCKVQDQLLFHVDRILENEACNKKIVESESKSKQDTDSYNKRIKYLQTEIQNIVDMSKSQLFDKNKSLDFEDQISQCVGSNNGIMDQCIESEVNCNSESWEEKLCELKTNISFYQSRCINLEAGINKAIHIMLSFRNIFKDEGNIPNNIFSGVSAERDEAFNKIQEEMVNMELFLKCYDTKQGYSYNADHAADFPNNELNFKEDTFQNMKSPNLMDNECKNMEVKQLQQDIKIKDDTINQLKQVILGRKEESESTLLENLNSSSPYSKDTINTTTNNERQLLLEQENKSLQEKLTSIQEKYDLNIKNLIAKYEQKIEEKDEEIKINEFFNLGTEKKHIVNEMKEQIENLQQDLDERGDAFEKLYEEHKQSVKSKDEEIQQLRSDYEKDMREQDKKWRSCLDRRLAEEEARHQQETAQLTREWTSQRMELETTSRLAVKAVESGSNSSDMMRRQVQALTLQLTELQSHRCESCEQQRAVANERLRSITSKYGQDCTEMEYLRNILYEYMMGKEPMVLARVLCALMKFDENQTRDIVLKEKQKVTVFGQLGIL